MRYDSELVEFVIREVIRRLQAGTDRPRAAAEPCDGRELILNDRVVTLATLSGRLDGVTCVVVPRQAVISPSVRDELRSRSIGLRATGT